MPSNCFLISAFAALFAAQSLLAVPVPQGTKIPGAKDLNAIGHRNVGQGVNFYSRDKETALGKLLAQEVERTSKLVDDYVATDYIERLAQNLAHNSDACFPITVKIIDSATADGFTLPGGFLYINKGFILQAETEAELASALAFGIAHTALRSGTKLDTQGELTRLASIPAMIFVPYGWTGYGIYLGVNLSIPLVFLKQQRDQVLSADFLALQYLYKTGYDPESYAQLIEMTRPKAHSAQSVPDAFSAFPPFTVRLQAMQKEIAKIFPSRDAAIVSSSDFEAIKNRLSHSSPTDSSPKPPGGSAKPTLRKPSDPATRVSFPDFFFPW